MSGTPIVSRKSTLQAPDGAIFATLIGLMYLSGRRMSLIAGPWYSTDDWQALSPHTMLAAVVAGQYFGAACKSAFLFDIRDSIENDGIGDNDLMLRAFTPNALHTGRDGILFLAFGNVIHEWDAGAEFVPYRWRSTTSAVPGQLNFAAAKLTLVGYPWPARAVRRAVSFRRGWPRRARPPAEPLGPFRLPANQRKVEFAAEVEGAEIVREIKFATSMTDLA